MTALTRERNTLKLGDGIVPEQLEIPVASSTRIFAGALVVRNTSGYAVPAFESALIAPAGVATQTVDNRTGASGDKLIEVRPGVFGFINSGGGDAITIADCGAAAYMVDDQTVAKTDGSGSRSVAGRIVDVQSGLVVVAVGQAPLIGELGEVTPAQLTSATSLASILSKLGGATSTVSFNTQLLDPIAAGVRSTAAATKGQLDTALTTAQAFTPTAGADWTDPDPTTKAAAINRLAAAVAGLLGTPIP